MNRVLCGAFALLLCWPAWSRISDPHATVQATVESAPPAVPRRPGTAAGPAVRRLTRGESTDPIWAVGGMATVPERFDDWNAFAAFAVRHMNATVLRDADGRVEAVTGRYSRAGARGAGDRQPDFVAVYLGGDDGVLTIGDQRIPLRNAAARSGTRRRTTQSCQSDDCIYGESWLTHAVVYHAAGSRTRQASGGNRVDTRLCCSGGGRLVNRADGPKCRSVRRGAWRYDRNLGRLVPTGPAPYTFTEPRLCRTETLHNQLTVRARLLFGGPGNAREWERTAAGTTEVEVGEWLIAARLELGPDYLDEVVGVCGFHGSNRGGTATTADGFTGDGGANCQ